MNETNVRIIRAFPACSIFENLIEKLLGQWDVGQGKIEKLPGTVGCNV